MTGPLESRDRPLEPLPGGYEDDLRRVDDRLRRLAAADVDRPGLEHRIFEASRRLLPEPALAPARAGDDPVVFSFKGIWSRAAMAACLALLCLAGWWTSANTTTEPADDVRLVLANDLDWHAADAVDALDREVATLLETSDIGSLSELCGEVGMVFPEVDVVCDDRSW